MMVAKLLAALLLATLLHRRQVFGNFRGAVVTWKPVPNTNRTEILFSYRIGWRLKAVPHNQCLTQPKQLNNGASQIYFRFPDGQIIPVRNANYFCNADVSISGGWLTGQNEFRYRIPVQLKRFQVGFSDCCWEALNEKNNNNNNKENTDKEKAKWMLWTTVDVTQNSSDANHSHQVINSSPVTNFQPVIYAITDCENEIKIPVFDVDNDVVRCRFAEGFEECGDACHNLLNATIIDERHCILRFKSPSKPDRFVVTLQIEDFHHPFSTAKPKSSVALQFVVKVTENTLNVPCNAPKPVFDGVSMVDDGTQAKCVHASVNKPLTLEIVVRNDDINDPVVDVLTSSPRLSTKTITTIENNNNNSNNNGSMNTKATIQWTPQKPGYQFFCFTALTKLSRSSEQYCRLIRAGDVPLNKNYVIRTSPESNSVVPIGIKRIFIHFQRKVQLLPADKQDILLYHSTKQSIVKGIKSNDINLISPYGVMVALGSFVREYNTEYHLVVKSLIANHPDDFCIEKEEKDFRIKDIHFTTAERQEPVITCDNGYLDIHLDKHYFAPHKIDKLHLEDEQCTATSNETHFHIKTTSPNLNTASSSLLSRTCLTQVNFNSSHMIFSNVLHYVINSNNMAAEYGFGVKMEGNMTLKCSRKRSSLDPIQKNNVIAAFYLPKKRALVSLTMFADETFQEKYTPTSLPINLNQASRLYFQVSLLDSKDFNEMRIVLENCYAESKPTASPDDDVDHGFGRRTYFVKERCIQVDLLNTIEETRRRIRFRLNPSNFNMYPDKESIFHCDVTLCKSCESSSLKKNCAKDEIH